MSTSQSSNSLITLEASSSIADRFSKPIIICSIDTFSHLSGFVTKLKGFQKFMQTYPSFRNKIVLIQFIPSVYCNSNISKNESSQSHTKDMTDSIASFKELKNDIVTIASEIHKEFGSHCLILQEGNPPLAKRLAIWS